MAQMLHILAEEVAQNKRLANRLAQPWLALMANLKSEQESKPKKKPQSRSRLRLIPSRLIWKGSILLIKALEDIDAAECKTIISHFALDPSRSYVPGARKKTGGIDCQSQGSC